jgi:hypothetical protein
MTSLFVYYTLGVTFGPTLVTAQLRSQSWWTTPLLLSNFITELTTLDFADYDSRRLALSSIQRLRIPQFFYTYPFDPLQYPLAPPQTQTRFPSPGAFVLLDTPDWLTPLQNLAGALAYRDIDGPILPAQTIYLASLATINGLVSSANSFYDRAEFELTSVIEWSVYPVIP